MFNTSRSNTILYCHQWLKTVHFYRQLLELPVSFENDWFVEFKLNESSFMSIADSTRASIQSVKGQGVTLSFEVKNLTKIKQELLDRNISTTEIKQKWHASVLYFVDPEGHRIELWEPIRFE